MARAAIGNRQNNKASPDKALFIIDFPGVANGDFNKRLGTCFDRVLCSRKNKKREVAKEKARSNFRGRTAYSKAEVVIASIGREVAAICGATVSRIEAPGSATVYPIDRP